MSELSRLEERVRILEREVRDLQASLVARKGQFRQPHVPVFPIPIYREQPEAFDAVREAERDLF